MARTQGSHSQITGPRIRAVALKLFAEHGYAAVSMRQIARDVGVQAGALYNYTPDKQDLLFSLMKQHMDELLEACASRVTSGDAMTRLHNFVDFHINFHMGRADEIFIAYMELRNLSPENFATIEALRRAYEDHLEAILISGQTELVFDVPDPKVTTRALIAMLTGITTWYRPSGALSPAEVADLYWNMTRKAVAA
ncbi:MAG: TetR/AcrR family transcriptional regulator [Pelagimonas sp.]|uniref:TetR/AcrR family transcriptional regulator n=1 Tax=Pelagimonas sp. TaxID=2073170 RepID=UPI003D6C31F4